MENNIRNYLFQELLAKVEKPGRYVGNEWNSINKDIKDINIRFAFCFPDIYEIGMSHLGMKILYHLLNDEKDIYCERVFAPWADMEEMMRKNKIKLFTLESKDYINTFDFVGFTLQYEMSYTNIINMLDLAGIAILSKDRGEDSPFIIAGGPCAYNPEPLSSIIDFFIIGDGEEVILEVMEINRKWKDRKGNRETFLELVAGIEGVYVPAFYKVAYNEDNTIRNISSTKKNLKDKINKRIVKSLKNSYFPEKMIVPSIEIVHDRIILEIFRGCTRGCRFCQVGMVYRPVRERTVEELLTIAERLIDSTGYDEISLSSLSTGDYTGLNDLVEKLLCKYEKEKIGLSLPSLRIDSLTLKLLKDVQKVRKSGLTFAPEAGTQRLRDVINKNVTEEDLMDSVGKAFDSGYSSIKLYFMIGLPTETMEDIEGIANLSHKVLNRYYEAPKEKRGKNININISISSFVPKAFTAFQWEAQDNIDELKQKQRYLQKLIRRKGLKLSWHEPNLSFLEAVFARGDRKLGKTLIKAWELGCKFDSWEQHFKYDLWIEAFNQTNIKPEFYGSRKRSKEEVLPWAHINTGVSEEYLIREMNKALQGKTTVDCRATCTNCGLKLFKKGVVCNDLYKNEV